MAGHIRTQHRYLNSIIIVDEFEGPRGDAGLTMICCSCHLGTDIEAETFGEKQTPIHYAAKNNAVESLKTLLKFNANINDRDYRNRTPIFIAAETARSDAVRFLLDYGAPVGIYDDNGTSCLSLMIAKMPHIALEAVEQFHYKDIAFRKHYYYLSYLEPAPKFLRPEVPKSKREKLYQKEMEKAEKHEMKEQGIRPKRKLKTFAKVPLEVGSDRIGL